ncbi:uncharacterized protein TRIVIDRAFT_160433, partial [Trichoderma virens Gv29-8]
KTYNSRCSLVVTHPTTNLPVRGLSMGEQTGPRILLYLWSYVLDMLMDQLIRSLVLKLQDQKAKTYNSRYSSHTQLLICWVADDIAN